MIDALLKQFMGSPQGTEALSSLQQEHGMSEGDAQNALSAVASGAANALGGHAQGGDIGSLLGGLTGGGSGQALMGALGGLSQGGGLTGALSGGASAMVIEKIAEVVSEKTGINKQTAVSVATTALPFVLKFLQSRGGNQGDDEAPQGGAADPADAVGGFLKKLF